MNYELGFLNTTPFVFSRDVRSRGILF